jgi:hypothetical protein
MLKKTRMISGLSAIICTWSAMLGAQNFSAVQITTVALVYDVVVANQ